MSGSLQFPMSSEDLKSNPIEMNTLKEEMSTEEDELGDEFISDVRPTPTPSIYHLVPDMEIKHEVDFHLKSIADSEDSSHLDLDTVPSIPLNVDCDSTNLNQFYSKDLSYCDENCATCEKYRMILMKHVRSTHDPHQPTHDPLHIGSLNVDHDLPQGDLSSLIPIKCEVEENINKMDCSQEMDFQYNPTSDAEEHSGRVVDTEIRIKHEVVGFHNNTTTSTPARDSDTDCGQDLEIVLNIPHIDCNSIKTEEKDLGDYYVDLLQCVRGCQTCEYYIRLLSEHVSTADAPPQPIQDPLLIDPLNIDPDRHQIHQSSSIEIKTEVEEAIEKMEYSEEESKSDSESEPALELERGSEKNPHAHLTEQPRRQRVAVPTDGVVRSSLAANGIITKKPYKCDECEKSFMRADHLSIHKRSHTGEKPFNCDECEKSFSTSSNLTVHKRSHTGERPYVCEECGKPFSRMQSLTRHKKHHTGETPYKCTVCEKSFTTSSVLNVHSKVHTGERPFKCDECGKSFTRSVHLTTHKRSHSGEKPYQCTVCEKSFTTSSVLNVHSKVHTGERPFKCDECGKSFTRSVHLTTHKRSHSGEKPYQCTVCGKSFTTVCALKVHTKFHTGEKSFKCEECEKSFTRSDHLTRHKRVHTGEKA